jgi:hypothetical protein
MNECEEERKINDLLLEIEDGVKVHNQYEF